ncbi:hypothetical protein H072_8094 [Dactylellina haptotyla CBS 200.50]|uniref:Uncharacterized protein n=1 Tax=Dactylellina haptotyla (strain CBS 200.50) TaxID=1284197 RepID=S8BSU2_DACHA|nr:hypothetical protein H072_8094 [Dactylellina haptotyla CBS 200.50]
MLSLNARSLAIGAAVSVLVSQAVALDCARGGISNTTAVRKTYPVPPISIYPLVGDFFNTKWSTLYSFDYAGVTHPPTPPNSSELMPPNATRTVIWEGYEFREQLIYINDTEPTQMFNLRWNLTNPPVVKEYTNLIIDGYIQDFKFTTACNGEASLMEWTVEFCSSNQAAGWDLFQNKTLYEADNLAMALNVTGADDGTWDVGCAIPTTTSTSMSTETATSTDDSSLSTVSTSTRRTSTNSPNGAIAMVTAMPVYGGALAIAAAVAVGL